MIRLSLNSANLSDYDPTYGEFTVRALAPSSVIPFDALGQKVSIRFGNGKFAQIWRVPAAEAQVIRDKLSMGNNVELDVLLAIKSVRAGPGGRHDHRRRGRVRDCGRPGAARRWRGCRCRRPDV